jgi:hypothetical protein
VNHVSGVPLNPTSGMEAEGVLLLLLNVLLATVTE